MRLPLGSAAGPAQSTPIDSDTAADDRSLLRAARSDPRAFALLYERYVGPVFGFCYVQLGNRASAEDVTSEVFLKALAGLDGYRNGAVAAWFLAIARNTIIDLRRRRRAVEPIEAAGEIADPGMSPEQVAEARAERIALRTALDGLPEDQRTAVELQLAGWSGEQIAAALGRSPAAVYMLRARALTRMEKSLRRAGWHLQAEA